MGVSDSDISRGLFGATIRADLMDYEDFLDNIRVVTAKKDISDDMRNMQHRRLTDRMLKMINKYRSHSLPGKCMEKLECALPDTFRFVLDSEIPADNNPAERHLREPVVHRKIRGCIRSEKTMEWLGALFTCVSTWKCQGLDYVKELAKYA